MELAGYCEGSGRSNSGLLFHCNDHEGHVVPLGSVLGKGQDLIQDASEHFRRRAPTAGTQQDFEPFLTPRFAFGVFHIRDSIGVRDQHITCFELKNFGGELRVFEQAYRCRARFQVEDLALILAPAGHHRGVVTGINVS